MKPKTLINTFKKFSSVALISILATLTFLPTAALASRSDLTLHNYYASLNQDSESELIAESVILSAQPTFKEFIIASYKSLGIAPRYTSTPFTGVSPELIPYLEDLRVKGIINFSEHSPAFHEDNVVLTWKAANVLLRLTSQEIPPVFDIEAYKLHYPTLGTSGFYAPTLMRAAQLGYFADTSSVRPFNALTADGYLDMLEAAKRSNTTKTDVDPIVVEDKNSTVVLPDEYKDLLNDETFLTFLDVYSRVTTKHIDAGTVNKDDLIYGAISGLVNALDDPYSAFQDPALAAAFQNSLSNEIQGIGASLDVTSDGEIIIVTPLSGSPAEQAGLMPGDIITAVDGKDTVNMNILEVISLIQGPIDSKVTLTIKRNGTTSNYSITRKRITVPSVVAETTFDNILYVKVTNFGFGTSASFKNLIDSTDLNSLNGLVIDLRFNPGGYLGGATDIGDMFVDEGKLLTKLTGPQVDSSVYAATGKQINNIPTVVLVNKGTASAAEILAGILQDYKLATIIGEKTFGKGTVQELTTYADSSALKLTIAKWLTPNGRSINGIGLTPDKIVQQSTTDSSNGIDTQKEEALRLLR